MLITTNTLTNCLKKDAQAYALAIDNNDPSIPFPNISVYVVGFQEDLQNGIPHEWYVKKIDGISLGIITTSSISSIFPTSTARDVVITENHEVVIVGDEWEGQAGFWWIERRKCTNLGIMKSARITSNKGDYAKAVAANINYLYVGGSVNNNVNDWQIIQLDSNLQETARFIQNSPGDDSITGLDIDSYNTRIAVSGYSNKDTSPIWHVGYIDIVPNSITYQSSNTFNNEYSTRICFDRNCGKNHLVYGIGANSFGNWVIRKIDLNASTVLWSTTLGFIGVPWGLAISPEKLSYQ